MNKFLIFVFLLINFTDIYSQEKIKIFRDVQNYTIIKDIIKTDDGIWIFKYDAENNVCRVLKMDNSNNIIVEGPSLNFFYNEDFRPFPNFLGFDSLNNVYLANELIINSIQSGIKIYKINPNGIVLWEQLLDFQNVGEIISRGQLFGETLIGAGTIYKVDEDFYKPFAFSLSLKDGHIIWQKVFEFSGVNGFFDMTADKEKKPVFMQVVLNEQEEYFASIVNSDLEGNLINSTLIPINNFFANRLIHSDKDNFIVSGFLDDAYLLKIDIKTQQIKWQSRIYPGWDDGDIDIFKFEDRILSLHTTYPGPDNIPGSGIELMVSLFDNDGNMTDSLFYDYDDKYETNTWNSFKGTNGKIYFCGVERTFLGDEEVYGFWGILNPDSLSVSTYTFKENANLVFYPNSIEPNSEVYFISDFNILSIELIDLNGHEIFNIEMNATSGNIKIPEIPSGLYFVVFKSKNGNQIKKLIIK